MKRLEVMFWDVGGVLLSNGWSERERMRAAEHFRLDWRDVERRHADIADAFETGRCSLDDYLAAVIFSEPRDFTRGDFRSFMFDQSVAVREVIDLAEQVERQNRSLMATLNNESTELNLHRIHHFGLGDIFRVFFSSCFLGAVKPDPVIYRRALSITQRSPEECLFIDDREANVEAAGNLGIHTIHFKGASRLAHELELSGVRI